MVRWKCWCFRRLCRGSFPLIRPGQVLYIRARISVREEEEPKLICDGVWEAPRNEQEAAVLKGQAGSPARGSSPSARPAGQASLPEKPPFPGGLISPGSVCEGSPVQAGLSGDGGV